jgi:hypothetical protein
MTAGNSASSTGAGNLVIPPQFDFALSFAEGLAPVLVGDKVGYVDRTGRMVIEPQFDSAFDFSEGLAPVQVDGKVGYIGHNAEMVIAPQFERAREFSGGLAAVTKEGKEVYIDASGAVVIDAPDFANAGDFAEGLAAVKIGEGIGYIDQLGAVVIEPVFEQAEPFRDGMAVVQTDDLWGVIASDGTWLLQIAKPRLAASTEVTASTGMTFSAEVAAPLIAATQDVLSTEIVAFTPLVAPESRAGHLLCQFRNHSAAQRLALRRRQPSLRSMPDGARRCDHRLRGRSNWRIAWLQRQLAGAAACTGRGRAGLSGCVAV